MTSSTRYSPRFVSASRICAKFLLLALPLCVPTLIFGAGAVEAHAAGLSAAPQLSILGALLAITVFFAPWAATVALRIAIE